MSRETTVRSVFDDWARRGRDAGMESGHLPAVLDTFNNWDWQPTDAFLDFGCGNGYAVRLAAERAPQGRSVGIDISGEMIDKAARLSAHLPTVEFRNTGLLDADFAPESFDKIFSMETVYYLDDIPGAFARIAELLRPRGVAAVLLDFYEENAAVHDWPDSVQVPMTLLCEDEYRRFAIEAGLSEVVVDRVRQPDKPGWQAEEGTLRIRGHR